MSSVPVQPIGCFVLVKMPPAMKATPGGILLPDDTAEKAEHATHKGELLGVGRNCRYVDPEDVGKTAFFGRYAGIMITEGEDKFRLIDEDEIRAVA